MANRQADARRVQITVAIAARRTGLSPGSIRRYMRRRLVNEVLSEAELVRLRRIRRLSELGINLAGIEVILDMRCRIEELQKQVIQLESKAGSSADQGLEHDRVQLLEWSV